jgi:hypothetical protein
MAQPVRAITEVVVVVRKGSAGKTPVVIQVVVTAAVAALEVLPAVVLASMTPRPHLLPLLLDARGRRRVAATAVVLTAIRAAVAAGTAIGIGIGIGTVTVTDIDAAAAAAAVAIDAGDHE